jgi:hypothetical protein
VLHKPEKQTMSHPQKKLPTAAALIAEHSTARVLHASAKTSITGFDSLIGMPQMSRRMTDADALAAQVKKYS